MLDNLLYIIFPYAAFTLAVVVTIQRLFRRPFTYSSLSSQFLEGDELFYGSVPWHIGILMVQVVLGVYTALFYRWGSSWYATSAVPYLRSLFLLQPDLKMIAPLPMAVKGHIVNAFVFLAILPFSRLVHMLVVPLHYLWRPYQVVIWNWDRRRNRRYRAPEPKKPALSPQPIASDAVTVAQPVTLRG